MKEVECLLFGLVIACPMDVNRHDCPLAQYRQIPLRLRIKHIMAMSLSDRRKLYFKHIECLEAQEKDFFNSEKS